MVDLLYRMLRDKDPFVVLNATHALNEILASEGGMVINRNIAHYLLSRFGSICHVSFVILFYHVILSLYCIITGFMNFQNGDSARC